MENSENKGIIEVDLRQLFATLWHRAWILILSGILIGAIAFAYAWFNVAPTYSASVQLYVNNNYVDSPGFSSSQIAAAQDLADTYMVILESRHVLEKVQQQTNLGYSYNQIRNMVSASAVNETEIFRVYVTCGDYRHAAIIANAIADILPGRISEVVEGSSVRIVDYAVENPNPVGPNYQRYALLGAIVGIAISAFIIVVAYLLDTTINTEEHLSRAYGEYPLLAVIPGEESAKGKYYYRGYYAVPYRRKNESKTGGAKK